MLDYQTPAGQETGRDGNKSNISSSNNGAPFDRVERRRSGTDSWQAPARAGAVAAASPAALAYWLTLSLDHVGRGMLLVTLGGRVLHANRLARSALLGNGAGGPLRLQDGRLQARHPREDKLLHDAISDALRKGLRRMLTLGCELPAVAQKVAPSVAQPALGAPYTVAVLPIDSAPEGVQAGVPGLSGQGHVVLISLPQPSRTQDLAVHCWARQYGLTGAETAVLQALLEGQAPPAIARAKGVGLCTVRSHIGKLRAKTESHTIRELLDRVAALPPMMVVLQ